MSHRHTPTPINPEVGVKIARTEVRGMLRRMMPHLRRMGSVEPTEWTTEERELARLVVCYMTDDLVADPR